MRISGVNSASPQMGAQQEMDNVTKNLQSQIERLKKQIQELANNDKLTPEQKLKKRQELQSQITDLQSQLRQHQMELRQKKQQEQEEARQEELREQKQQREERLGIQETGLSADGVKALISSEKNVGEAKVQGSVAKKTEHRAKILSGEIKQDAARGSNVESKQRELAKLESKAREAVHSQMDSLGAAIEDTKKAREAERESEKEKSEREKEEEREKKSQYPSVDILL